MLKFLKFYFWQTWMLTILALSFWQTWAFSSKNLNWIFGRHGCSKRWKLFLPDLDARNNLIEVLADSAARDTRIEFSTDSDARDAENKVWQTSMLEILESNFWQTWTLKILYTGRAVCAKFEFNSGKFRYSKHSNWMLTHFNSQNTRIKFSTDFDAQNITI